MGMGEQLFDNLGRIHPNLNTLASDCSLLPFRRRSKTYLNRPLETHFLQDPDPFLAERRLFRRILANRLVVPVQHVRERERERALGKTSDAETIPNCNAKHS